MPDVSLNIRRAERADVPAILDLMRASLGEAMPRTQAFFEWKHFDNPFGESLISIAEDDEGLVGLRAMMRWDFRVGGRTVRAVRPVDTATHPRFRRRGLFRRLTTELLEQLPAEGIDVVFNTPNDKSRPGYLKMGWNGLGKLSIWLRPGGVVSVLKGAERSRFTDEGLSMPELADLRAHTLSAPGFLDWRYGDGSGLGYQVSRDGDVAVVHRSRERGGRLELTVAQLVVPARALIPRAARLLRRTIRSGSEIQVVAMAGSHTREGAVLGLAGFVPVPRVGPHFVMRPVPGRTPESLLSPSGWRIQIGDLEVF